MKVLVTGATGFTGDKLARKLFRMYGEVRLLVRNRSKVKMSQDFSPEIIEGDIRDKEAVEKAVRGCKRVFNVAAMFRTAGLPDDAYREIHLYGTLNLLEASLKNSIERFVHCSTVGVHGDIKKPPADENSPFGTGDIYQETKLEGELRATQFYKETGLPVAIIRPTPIYGPGDLRLLKLFKLASRPVTPLIGNGNIFYHMVYVDDLVDAFLLAAEKKEAVGGVFIIGGAEILTLNQLVDIISHELGKPSRKFHMPAAPFQTLGTICERVCKPFGIEPPLYRRRVDFFTKSRSFDITRAVRFLEYTPKVSISSGVKETARWYREQKLI